MPRLSQALQGQVPARRQRETRRRKAVHTGPEQRTSNTRRISRQPRTSCCSTSSAAGTEAGVVRPTDVRFALGHVPGDWALTRQAQNQALFFPARQSRSSAKSRANHSQAEARDSPLEMIRRLSAPSPAMLGAELSAQPSCESPDITFKTHSTFVTSCTQRRLAAHHPWPLITHFCNH